jgi:class 3 adenylate cyclase
VTALFADIKGSMDLMEELDPEEARAIVDPALRLMIDSVHHYNGYIVQSTGDGIFALFGAPIAYEDHAHRALYAALRMQTEMRKYSARLREAGNPPLEIRIGVNTGEVVVRSIRTDEVHTEYTLIGHSTSLAARMQTLAPTGSIAITEATRKLTKGYFDFKSLGPARVKGVSEPVSVYEVLGLGALRGQSPGFASNPTALIPSRAQISSLSDVSPEIPTAPIISPSETISTPPGAGTSRPPLMAVRALKKTGLPTARPAISREPKPIPRAP